MAAWIGSTTPTLRTSTDERGCAALAFSFSLCSCASTFSCRHVAIASSRKENPTVPNLLPPNTCGSAAAAGRSPEQHQGDNHNRVDDDQRNYPRRTRGTATSAAAQAPESQPRRERDGRRALVAGARRHHRRATRPPFPLHSKTATCKRTKGATTPNLLRVTSRTAFNKLTTCRLTPLSNATASSDRPTASRQQTSTHIPTHSSRPRQQHKTQHQQDVRR